MVVIRIILEVLCLSLLAYQGIIIIYFIMTWIRSLYGSKVFDFFQRASYPFMRIFSGKLLIGPFDLGSTIGLVLLGGLIDLLYQIAMNI